MTLKNSSVELFVHRVVGIVVDFFRSFIASYTSGVYTTRSSLQQLHSLDYIIDF